MFREEKVIDGVLHIRHTINGKWKKCSLEYLTQKVIELQKELNKLS